jgi:hypothetical protein
MFVVAGGDSAELLEPPDAPLDPVAAAVGSPVEVGLAVLVGLGG